MSASKVLTLALVSCLAACHHDPSPRMSPGSPPARILTVVPSAAAVTALIDARTTRFASYWPDRLGFDRAHTAIVTVGPGSALVQCRLASESRDQVLAAWQELVQAVRAARPPSWEAHDEGTRFRIGPPGDVAIVVSWSSHGLLHKTYEVELDAWSGSVPGAFDPASGDPVADVLAASAHAFTRYSPAPLGFPETDDSVLTRIDDTTAGKALHCERRSGSKHEIEHAFRSLVERFKTSVPKTWRVDDRGDVVTFFPPGPDASSAVEISWVDNKPGFMNRFSTRPMASPPAGERYVLSLDVYPVKP